MLHNRRLDTAIGRIVLMAKLRPVVEHGSTVWHAASAQERNKIEAVVLVVFRVMKLMTRFLAVFENLHLSAFMTCFAWSGGAGHSAVG